MSTTVVLGAQWGDEGKGKVTDFFASSADFVVRFQGGNNAGHTIVVGDEKLALSLTPSGVLYPNCIPVIGSGCVIDLGFLKEELEMLNERNVNTEKLAISPNAHVVMPYHKLLDELIEESLGENKIGTTKKGIGPCYADKIQRRGIRVQDLLNQDLFEKKVKANIKETNLTLTKIYNKPPLVAEEIINEFKSYTDMVTNHITDTSLLIDKAIKDGKSILFEGAQGTLLDIDHGTYPYVTSSSTTAGGVSTGLGIGPKYIDKIIGISKAYTTRVGEGPFITELFDEDGSLLAKRGNEFGATTGRPRRCGWLDLVALKKAIFTNSVTDLCITKLDVLDETKVIRACVEYKNNEPVYKEFDGWLCSTEGITEYSELPDRAKMYIEYIEEYISCSASIISTGPSRDQTISK